jgi:hypothetical protein
VYICLEWPILWPPRILEHTRSHGVTGARPPQSPL